VMAVPQPPRDGHTYSELLVDTEGQAGTMIGETGPSTLPLRGKAGSAIATVLLLGALATWHGSGSAQSSLHKADLMDIVQASGDDDSRLPRKACFYSKYKYDPDMPGQGRSKKEGHEKCQQRCLNTTGCAHISFWSDGGCHLSNATAELKKADDKTVAGPPECALTCFEQGVSYEPLDGAGLRTSQASAQACHRKCQETDECATFTWWPDGGCHLQAAGVTEYGSFTPTMVRAVGPYVISGPQDCPLILTTTTTTTTCYKAHSEYEPLDMHNQSRSSEGSIEECIQRCHSVEGCAHIAYWEDEGCHLQDAAATLKRGSTTAMSGTPHCAWACYKSRKQYEPLGMRGQPRIESGSITDCQQRCRETEGCAHISYWSDGGCHLADGEAKEVAADGQAMAGPPTCDED